MFIAELRIENFRLFGEGDKGFTLKCCNQRDELVGDHRVPAPVTFCGCATGSGISAVSCGTTCPGAKLAGTYTAVSAQATYSTILNYQFAPQNYNFSAQATARLQ